MYVANHNKVFTLKEVERLIPEAIDTIKPAMCQNSCQHTSAVKEEHWTKYSFGSWSYNRYYTTFPAHQYCLRISTALASTTTRAVRKAIASLSSVSVDDLKIKRKYKTAENAPSSAAPNRVTRWWFVVRSSVSIL